MSRRGYHPVSARVFSTSAHHSHPVLLLAASSADHQITSAPLHVYLFMLTWTEEKETKTR